MYWSAKDLTVAAGGTYPTTVGSTKVDFNGVVITYATQNVTATKGIGTITTQIKAPTLTWKDDSGKAYTATTYTYTINGGKEIDITTLKSTTIDLKSEITYAKLEAAAKEGKTYLEDTFEIAINLYENADAKSGNPLATATFKIVVRTDITTLTFDDDSENNQDWSKQIYELVKATPVTETEENKTTEENKKDDVPKTGEVIYRCC